MRITVTFQNIKPEGFVELPLHYNYALQGFIYNHISTHLASFLHNRGYRYQKRVFRMFTFSRLEGRYHIEKEKEAILFAGPVTLHISSPVDDFLQEFAETLARASEVSIEKNMLVVSSIEVHFSPDIDSLAVIKMLSPLTCYSTFVSREGKKKTYYFSPFEKEFSELVRKNIVKKYISFYGRKPVSEDLKITPLKVNKNSE
ncbi:CRISPR-associated endoribonuclease Cas6, partial [Candidatus Aerophobetes bacterium]|nr:CRISPR-associated endoribonuclease Cas6 [Candidatus Aerophobetes bacterium]